MSTPVLPAARAADDVLLSAQRRTIAKIRDAVDSVLFWGILGFGILLPFLGAGYALLRQ